MEDIRELGIRNVQFKNWSETFGCSPELYFVPSTEEEIKRILKLAKVEGKKVQSVGSGHSPSNIACTNGYMISLEKLNRVISVDEEKKQITVQAGITLKSLNEEHLPSYGLAFSVLGSTSDISVGGAISTGTHGSGMNYGLFSTYVVDLHLLTPDGSILYCSSSSNEDVFQAALCSLGALGIILTVTLQCEPVFNLIQNQYGATLQEVIENLNVHLTSSDHFRFMWFPYTDHVVVSHLCRTQLTASPKTWLSEMVQWFWEYALGYYLLEFCYYISTYLPRMVPVINQAFYHIFARRRKTVDVSHKLFGFECLFKQYVNEWAISRDKAGEVLWDLKQWIETNDDKIYVHFPVEVRFVKADNIPISPAYGRDSCYINIIMYRPYGINVAYRTYWEAYEKIMEKAGGRPHWAKDHTVTYEKFTKMYPKFTSWCSVRDRLDPTYMFCNSYLTRIFQSRHS